MEHERTWKIARYEEAFGRPREPIICDYQICIFHHSVQIGILCRQVALSGTTSTGKSTVNIIPVRILGRMTLKCVFFLNFSLTALPKVFVENPLLKPFFSFSTLHVYSVVSVCEVDGCLFSLHTNDCSRSTSWRGNGKFGRHQWMGPADALPFFSFTWQRPWHGSIIRMLVHLCNTYCTLENC